MESIHSRTWESGPARRETRAEVGMAEVSNVMWGCFCAGTCDADAKRCCMYSAWYVWGAAQLHEGIGLR